METKIPMTLKGYHSLQEELQKLKTVERPNVIQDISRAREYGDLSENAEYHAAKEKQGFIEGRIVEIEHRLGLAEVIDVSLLNGDFVKFGATVTLIDEDTEETVTYQIVGEDESNIKEGRLSISSPLARALIGKVKKAPVEFTTPSGHKSYEVIDVQFI
jgi:transcription elongation factor GreA